MAFKNKVNPSEVQLISGPLFGLILVERFRFKFGGREADQRGVFTAGIVVAVDVSEQFSAGIRFVKKYPVLKHLVFQSAHK